RIYSDGIRHSLELPYSVFEDQRSGETLGKLQKVRTDVEKLISVAINVLFTSLVGIVFVMVYAIRVHWIIAPVYFLTVPVLGVISSVLSKRIKQIQKVIVAETTALAGSTTESLRNIELVKSLGLGQQEIQRLNATTRKILTLELKKVKYLRSRSEERRVGKECRSLCDWSSDVCSSDLLVKSLGLGQQEIQRLNATTRKILTLELKKVKYLRS